jgi:hypothetical protein
MKIFKKTLIEAAITAIREYCREDGISRRDYSTTVRLVRDQRFDDMNTSDWFMLFDAMGTRGEEFFTPEMRQFYRFAMFSWRHEEECVRMEASAT